VKIGIMYSHFIIPQMYKWQVDCRVIDLLGIYLIHNTVLFNSVGGKESWYNLH